MGAVLGSILPLRLVVAVVFHVVWPQLSALSSSLVARIPSMRVALPWPRHPDPTDDLLHWNVRIQLMRDPCPPYHHWWMSPTASPSCLFCVSDRDEACMRGMIQVTLVQGAEESLSEVALWRRGRVSFIPSEFLIRRNVRGYTLPTRWSYMLHEYGAYSSLFHLPAVGCTAVMEAPIDWGSVEALPAPSERCEASAAPPYERRWRGRFRNARRADMEHRYSVSCSNRSLDRIHHRHRQVSRRMRAGRSVPVFGMKASGGRTMTTAAATVMALPAVLSAALLEVACTRKVNNAHCILKLNIRILLHFVM